MNCGEIEMMENVKEINQLLSALVVISHWMVYEYSFGAKGSL